jgi:hypothetical protein
VHRGVTPPADLARGGTACSRHICESERTESLAGRARIGRLCGVVDDDSLRRCSCVGLIAPLLTVPDRSYGHAKGTPLNEVVESFFPRRTSCWLLDSEGRRRDCRCGSTRSWSRLDRRGGCGVLGPRSVVYSLAVRQIPSFWEVLGAEVSPGF